MFSCFLFFVLILLLGLTAFKITIHEKNVTLLIGHRGFSSEYTENTPSTGVASVYSSVNFSYYARHMKHVMQNTFT